MKIGLISCVQAKRDYPCKAKDMYISPIFKYGFKWLMLNTDKVYIMSAKYGLLSPTTTIEPYNTTLNNMNINQRKRWSYNLYLSLEKETDIRNDIFFIEGG